MLIGSKSKLVSTISHWRDPAGTSPLPTKRHTTSHPAFPCHVGAHNGSQKVCQWKRWFWNPLHHPLRQGHWTEFKTFWAISHYQATLKRRNISWCRNPPRNLNLLRSSVRRPITNPCHGLAMARLYTYGQVTGVHGTRWGPDQRSRCRSQNLQWQWADQLGNPRENC